MRRWRWHILLFVGVYLTTLLATLPAALAYRWAEPLLAKSPQRPQLTGIDGTLWSGRAASAGYQGRGLGELQWQLSPWALLLGRVAMDIRLNSADGYLEGSLSSSFDGKQLRIRGLQGQLPAAQLTGIVPALMVVPTGSFAVNIEQAEIEASRLSRLDGRLVWNKGGVASPLALEFGDLVAEFASGSDGVTARIKDSGGPLQLTAELKLKPDGSYLLSGKGAARPGAAPALATSLSMLGQADGQGMIPFQFNGRL